MPPVFPVIPVKLRQVHYSRPSSKISLRVVSLGHQRILRNHRKVPVFSARQHRSPNNLAALGILPPTKVEDYSDCRARIVSSNSVGVYSGEFSRLKRRVEAFSGRSQTSRQINSKVSLGHK